jgi:hypothetical protein
MARANPLLRVKKIEERKMREKSEPDVVAEIPVEFGTDAHRDAIHDLMSKRKEEAGKQPRTGSLIGGKICKRCGGQKGGNYTTLPELNGPNPMMHYPNNSAEMCAFDPLATQSGGRRKQKGGSSGMGSLFYTPDFTSTMESAVTDSHGDLIVPPRLDVSPVVPCSCAEQGNTFASLSGGGKRKMSTRRRRRKKGGKKTGRKPRARGRKPRRKTSKRRTQGKRK